jgi:hypothetical protein
VAAAVAVAVAAAVAAAAVVAAAVVAAAVAAAVRVDAVAATFAVRVTTPHPRSRVPPAGEASPSPPRRRSMVPTMQ